MRGGSYFGSNRNPEVKLVIRMYHDGDDARSVLKQQSSE